MSHDETIFAIYPDEAFARSAVLELTSAGINSRNINIISNDIEGRYKKFIDNGTTLDNGVKDGTLVSEVVSTLTGLTAAIIPGIGPIFAMGPLATAIVAGIGATTGTVNAGIATSLVNFGIGENEAYTFQEVLRRGGSLVMVQSTENDKHDIEDILELFNPLDIEDYEIRLREGGWDGYDQYATHLDLGTVTLHRNLMKEYARRYGGNSPRIRRYIPPYSLNRPGMRSFYSFEEFFRDDYDTYFFDSVYSYPDVYPAYEHAYFLATAPRFGGYTWEEIEKDARFSWEAIYPEPWADFKDTVYRTWHAVRSTMQEPVT